MIVAVILAGKSGAEGQGYLRPLGEESVIEHVAAQVMRGPFGGTIVAAHPEIALKIKAKLNGFAVQFVETKATDAKALTVEALKAAAAFRARWEKAMAAAAGRFTQPGGKTAEQKQGTDWAKHKQHADVKIRGLASSFDRDGVMLIPGDAADVTKEKLAELIEKFAQLKTPEKLLADSKIAGLTLLSREAADALEFTL